MPFIVSKVNVPVPAEQELALKTRLGKAIELVPGKSEPILICLWITGCMSIGRSYMISIATKLWNVGENKANVDNQLLKTRQGFP